MEMSVSNRDNFLVEISDEQLSKLATFLENNAPNFSYIAALVHTGIKWKQSPKFSNLIQFYSPNNSWEIDGTIIVTIQFGTVDIFVFTLEETCTNLYRGLSQTPVLDDNNVKLIFYNVNEKHVSTVRRVLQEKMRNFNELPHLCYTVSPDEAKTFNTECPPEVYVKKLEPSAILQVNAVWPHRYPGSDKYLAHYVETNGGYGVFLKSNNEMVAWILRHVCGNMTMLQTEEAHKRKGFASLATKTLAKEIGSEGFWPTSTIMTNNINSLNMFEKLGFRKIAHCTFFLTY